MKIDHFFIKQLKKNLRILLIFFINLILVVFLILFINNYFTFYERQKDTLTKEITLLKKKKDSILFVENLKDKDLDIDIDKINKTLLVLIPQSEDYFSIIHTLEEISKKTNYLITDYSLNLKDSSSDKLSIAINGVGDKESFLNFIKNYRFGGGRLVTIEELRFSESNINPNKKINLNFYTDKEDKIKDIFYKITQNEIDLLNDILSSVRFEEKDKMTLESEEIIDYETKTNPF